jgi:hypothetical protein
MDNITLAGRIAEPMSYLLGGWVTDRMAWVGGRDVK